MPIKVEISPTFQILSYFALAWVFLLWSVMVIRMIYGTAKELKEIDSQPPHEDKSIKNK